MHGISSGRDLPDISNICWSEGEARELLTWKLVARPFPLIEAVHQRGGIDWKGAGRSKGGQRSGKSKLINDPNRESVVEKLGVAVVNCAN